MSFRNAGRTLLFLAVLLFAAGILSSPFVLPVPAAFAQGEKPKEGAKDDAVDEQLNAAAEDGEEAAKEEDAPKSESYLYWYIGALGPLFAPAFAVTSILFVMLVVMNWMTISRNSIMPQAMIDTFKQQLDDQQFQEAYENAKASDSPQGKIFAAGLAKMQAGYDTAEKAMSDIAEEEIMRIEQKLGYIALIAAIAPMLGLLGTVFGMVESFQVIAQSGQTPQASELAKGIATALITTQVGLLIAIPAMIIYEWFRNKLALLLLEMTIQTESLMSRFKPQ
ncbi:MAG: MotA/TolQ/ExbB proton channel family protein [Planctomycetaceae bacterium]|jgi:biopolymer transport protein ExbB|nr:MotA/TolQ/ExbB proton channel family protein [Planctomycetaceae bacterium]